jgi:hypothetical protein
LIKEPKLRFPIISAETVSWDTIKGRSVEDRIGVYRAALEILTSILDDQECPPLKPEPGEAMYLVGRLGDERTSSNVFRVGFRDYEGYVVIKILPDTDLEGEEGRKEAEIAKRASDAVETGETPYFPLVFGHGTCDNVVMPLPSPLARGKALDLYKKARDWSRSRIMIEKWVPPSAQPEAFEWAKGKESVDVLKEIRKGERWELGFTFKRGGQTRWEAKAPVGVPPIRGQLILMEIAWGDMSMYLRRPERVEKEEQRTLVLHCLYAIRDLQRKLGVVHRDLVLENILIQKIEEGPIPLITDFGEAVEFTGRGGREERLFDVVTFFRALRGKTTNLVGRIDAMLGLIVNPENYTYGYGFGPIQTMTDVIRYWKMSKTAFMDAFQISREFAFTMDKLGEKEEKEEEEETDDRLARFLM